MLLRLRLLTGTLIGSVLLLVMLCLGSQNLEQREELNLGIGHSAPLPTGFVVGIALICGVLSGGSSSAAALPPLNTPQIRAIPTTKPVGSGALWPMPRLSSSRCSRF